MWVCLLSPLFVTWTKLSPSGGARLRGCIGTLDPHYIHKGLRDYALTRCPAPPRPRPVPSMPPAAR